MSGGGEAAADRIKAAALSSTKGLSRAQAERAAAAAARNVNAYGQKEEGPSRWQERKEAKRQMYLMSTEKAVKLGERKDLKTVGGSGTASSYAQCQKCYQTTHWTYECKNERVYIPRPSRSQILKNPKLKINVQVSYEDHPDFEGGNDEGGGGDKKKGDRRKRGGNKGTKSKRKHHSPSDSEDSVFDSDSNSSVTGSGSSSAESGSSSTSSDSDERRRRKQKQKQKQKKRSKRPVSSSSESSGSSDSDSSDDRSHKKKSRRHGR